MAALLGLIVLGTGLFATPANAAPVAARPVSLTFMSYIPDISPAAASTLQNIVSGFEHAHPNIHVKIEPTSSSLAQGIVSSIQQEVAAGTPPDVAQDSFDSLKFAASGLGAQPLDEVVGKAAVGKAYGGDHPYAPAATKLGELNGHTYALPWTNSTPVLFYNKTLFQQAGISGPPKNWAEVESDAAAIKQKTGADGLANGCVSAVFSEGDWCLQSMVLSDGGSILNGNRITWGNTSSVAALKALQGVANSGALVDQTPTQNVAEFGAGKLAMFLTTSATQSSLLSVAGKNFQVADAPEPGFGNRQAVPTASGSGLFMLTRDQAKQKASWELMRWLTDDASETAITENIGYPPLRPTLVNDSRYLKSWSHTEALLPVNLTQIARVKPIAAYPGPNFLQIEEMFVAAAGKVIFQNANPRQTMQQAQSQAQGLVGGS